MRYHVSRWMGQTAFCFSFHLSSPFYLKKLPNLRGASFIFSIYFLRSNAERNPRIARHMARAPCR